MDALHRNDVCVRIFCSFLKEGFRMKKLIVRGGSFIALLAVVLYVVSLPFRNEDYRIHETYHVLYESEPGTCDAVLMGGSNAYSYWQTPIAYSEKGITVLNMGIPSLQTSAFRYVVDEARKTQPDALYIFTANSFKWFKTRNRVKYATRRIHYAANYMKFGKNKIGLINRMCNYAGIGLARLKFLYPVMEFHGNWNKLDSRAYVPRFEDLKAGATYEKFLYGVSDVTKYHCLTDERLVLDPVYEDCLNDFLDYLQDNHVRCLFVRLPQAMGSEENVSRLNSVCDIIESRGFDLLDLQNSEEELGISYKLDFYNKLHANVHGAQKFTTYLTDYLVKNYGFEDKRGVAGYEDWDEATRRYNDFLKTALFDFEMACAPRAFDVTMSPLNKPVQDGDGTVHLSWSAVEGADRLAVYRRMKEPEDFEKASLAGSLSPYHWTLMQTLPADATSFEDATVDEAATYYYAVVPVVEKDGSDAYGSFDTRGVSIQTRG